MYFLYFLQVYFAFFKSQLVKHCYILQNTEQLSIKSVLAKNDNKRTLYVKAPSFVIMSLCIEVKYPTKQQRKTITEAKFQKHDNNAIVQMDLTILSQLPISEDLF